MYTSHLLSKIPNVQYLLFRFTCFGALLLPTLLISHAVAFEKELQVIQENGRYKHKKTEQCKKGCEKCADLEESDQFIKNSSKKIEVIYNSQSQGPLLTRVYFPFEPKVSFGLFTPAIILDNYNFVFIIKSAIKKSSINICSAACNKQKCLICLPQEYLYIEVC